MQPSGSRETTLLQCSDIRRITVLVGGGLATSWVPEAAPPTAARALLGLYRYLQPTTLQNLEAKMRTALPASAWPNPHEVAEAHVLMRLEDMWGRLRGMRRFGWHPRIEWEGLDRLEPALRDGRGVIVWSMRFSSATVIKKAFYDSRMPLVHLSRVDHGSVTTTPLGLGVAAPLYCRAEDCYLKERVQIPQGDSLAYVKVLRDRLRTGELVSVFGEHTGLQNFEADILGMKIPLALGAPSLAWLENAALFTLAPIRIGPFHYRVVIDEEIPVDRNMPRRKFAAVAAQEYARRLKARILHHPADWQGWLFRDF